MDLVETGEDFVLRADLPGLAEKGVDPEAVRAHFENGVLEVRIPKPEERKPRKVAINVGGGATGTIEGSGETVGTGS
jgi:HSP20 family molecular chaperone IbpA